MKKEPLNLVKIVPICLALFASIYGCRSGNQPEEAMDELFSLFADPPPECRPFVRWWWNGDCIEVDELRREMEVMKAAGIGGVEINPIAHPDGTDLQGTPCYEWLSPEWSQRVKAVTEMAGEKHMIVDLIMGSGWPFGGEFLEDNQLLQGVGIRRLTLEGPGKVTLSIRELWQLPGRNFGSLTNPDAPEAELFFLQMIPHGASGVNDLIDLADQMDEDGKIEIQVPDGPYELYIGTFQKAYRTVMHGAPGSKGPIVDHFDEDDVRAYMDRLGEALEQVLSGKLGDHIRALFCDSLELSGANITDDFYEEFFQRRGYRMEPFMPLVYYHPYQGYTDTLRYDESFNNDIRRIRYDFNKTLVELFLERFTSTFDSWANAHGMQSRYQAYGMPWLMGMLDGYRMVDIPESNNWLYSADAKGHGYWIWNKYCASGAHLSGSRTVSSEAMTNTRGVFRMTLNMIKKNDDFNFISGINHSVLHGFNYSPPEAGFPGWIRYGAYFSEQNTWWPFFRLWTGYNARLSSLFQHSEPVTDIAILTPEADVWRQWGLVRYPYYMHPWYHHDLWEGFSRIGITADYINEGVIRRAEAVEGGLQSENCTYQLVIISSATSMEPETASAIRKLAEKGVRFVFVEHFPTQSAGYHEKERKDREVRDHMAIASSLESVSLADPPAGSDDITRWTSDLAGKYQVRSPISIHPNHEKVYAVKYTHLGHPIFFLSNQDEEQAREFRITLDADGMIPWRWDPETGTREIFPHNQGAELDVKLQPLESLLLVLEENDRGPMAESIQPDEAQSVSLHSPWEVQFRPISADPFRIEPFGLVEFGNHGDPRVSTFAGNVHYTTTFDLDKRDWKYLDLGPQKQVTRVVLNGHDLGVRWWGRHLYRIGEGQLKPAGNRLEIIYTTTLANYANSLADNTAAKRWIDLDQPEPMGLTNPVSLLKDITR